MQYLYANQACLKDVILLKRCHIAPKVFSPNAIYCSGWFKLCDVTTTVQYLYANQACLKDVILLQQFFLQMLFTAQAGLCDVATTV